MVLSKVIHDTNEGKQTTQTTPLYTNRMGGETQVVAHLKLITMRFALFILICCIIASLCSCSKQTDYSYLNTDRRGVHRYEEVIDWYDLDTTHKRSRVYVQDLGELTEAQVAQLKPMWYVNCNQLTVLEHLYYQKK